ncbi:hypothetical protein [Megalodesulfovibrio paquesii]
MTPTEIIAIVESGIRLGLAATDIVQRLCGAHGGEAVPTLAEFEARVDALRAKPGLAPATPAGVVPATPDGPGDAA